MSDNNKNTDTVLDAVIDSLAGEAADELFDAYEQGAEPEFTDEHNKKMEKIISHAFKVHFNKRMLLVAVIAMVLALGAAFSVTARRDKFGDFYIINGQRGTTFRLSETIPTEGESAEVNRCHFFLGYIPEGYESNDNLETKYRCYDHYVNEAGDKEFTVTKALITDTSEIPTKGEGIEMMDINGNEVFKSQNNGVTSLKYTYQNILISIEGNIDETELINIAENMK